MPENMHLDLAVNGCATLDRNVDEELLVVVPGTPCTAPVVNSLEHAVDKHDGSQAFGVGSGFEKDMLLTDRERRTTRCLMTTI